MSVFSHHRSRGKFIDWVSQDFKNMFPDFSDKLVSTENIVYQKLRHFDNYPGKTLMLVGGGPSASSGWEDKKYDFIWTMNHFYKNPIFNDKKVDLAMMMAEPDTYDSALASIRERGTCIGFEVHDKWANTNPIKYKNNFCMHTRFYGRIGIGARMKIFAAQLGFAKVYFTGFDGPKAIFEGNHFFEPGKKTLPSVFSGMNLDQVSYHWKIQYDHLWRHIREINTDIEFVNIGGGELYHEECK